MLLTNPPEPSELEQARRRHGDVVSRARQLQRRQRATRAAVVLVLAAMVAAVPLGLAHSSHSSNRVVTTSPSPSPSVCSVDCEASTSTLPTSTSTPATAPPVTQSPALLERGKEAARSSIPWSQVGPGWTLALWGAAPGLESGGDPPAGQPNQGIEAQTLYLVNPIGGRYAVASFPAGTPVGLADWSPSGRVALLASTNAPGSTALIETDLVSGHTQRTQAPAGVTGEGDVALTRPSGRAFLITHSPTTDGSYRPTLERLGLDGAHQLTYPTAFAQVGAYTGSWLSAPDGSQLAIGAAKGLAIVGNDGRVIRELLVPDNTYGCAPIRWWSPGIIVTKCDTRLWLVPTSGAAPMTQTAVLTGNGPDTGDLNSWSVGSSTYVQAAGACGVVYLARLNPDGTTSRVDVPGVDNSESVEVLGTAGAKLALLASAGCGGGRSVLWFDPVANTADVILGPPLNGGGVTSALAYPD